MANILIIALTVSAISSLFLFKDVSSFIITELQEKVDISVYFTDEALEDDILSVKNEIEHISEVKEVEYVSKDKALADFTLRHKDDPVLMEALDEVVINPFLASLNIKAFTASQYEAVSGFLESADLDIVENINYHERKPVIDSIFKLTSNLGTAGIIVSVLLAVIAILVAFNTIRLSIYSSREEIKIQRLVGASNWFIRGPFLAQGAIVGVFAAIISFLVIVLFAWILNAKFAILFYGLNLFSLLMASFWKFLLIQLFIGISLGMLSSFIAVRRYLRV